ncbi:MAG: MerR family transcriptional regulator [Chitinophagaceae bacterium]
MAMEQLSLFEVQQQLQQQESHEIKTNQLSKVYYTITEVAAMYGVNASLLRFWEKEFPAQLSHLKKNKKGDRYYSKKDIENLNMIFHLVKDKKMTLEGARSYLKSNKKKIKEDQNILDELHKVKSFLLDLKKNID